MVWRINLEFVKLDGWAGKTKEDTVAGLSDRLDAPSVYSIGNLVL